MPPPIPNPSNRMTANPLRPVRRYRPGKAVAEEEPSSDEEEEENEEQEQQQRVASRKAPVKPNPQTRHGPTRTDPTRPADDGDNDDDDDEEGFVTDEDDEDVARPPTSSATKAGSAEVRAGLGGDRGVRVGGRSEGEEDEEEDEEGEEDEEEDESSDEEEEESSSEDEPQRKFLRPTFIKSADRKTSSGAAAAGTSLISAASNGIVRDEAGEQEEARRREMADLMIKDKLERDAAARAAGKKSWDDDDEVVGEDVVDDTDDVDPEAELAAWKLRELKRLKRDREAIEAHEREIEERERRSKLTQAERDAEDAERLARQKEEREEGRGKAGFMQRYHHKGAFFQDDETAEMLRKRDLMGARYVDEVKNREALPEYMQIRNMEKLGKKGRTRYKDLKGEDTGRWGDYAKQDARFLDRNRGPDLRNVDERFQPDREGGGRAGPTGANASAVGNRRKRSPSPYRDREGEKKPRLEAT
jgi:microfibrillar-associated protein 1